MKMILPLMAGLSRRHLRPKPIDFLLPWLYRRDIKSRRRILVNIWSLNTKSHRLADDHESLFYPYIIGSQTPGSKEKKKFDARKDRRWRWNWCRYLTYLTREICPMKTTLLPWPGEDEYIIPTWWVVRCGAKLQL